MKVDNYELNKKEREIEKIRYLMRKKDQNILNTNSPNQRNKNNTLNNDRLTNCFTIFSLKAQPLLSQKEQIKLLILKINYLINL